MSRKFIRNHLPVLFMAAGIFLLSSVPSLKAPGLGFHLQDKFYHFMEYAIFGLLLCRSADAWPGISIPASLIALLAGILYAASDEWHQTLVPGREGDLADFMADTAGLAVAVTIWSLLRKRNDKKTKAF